MRRNIITAAIAAALIGAGDILRGAQSSIEIAKSAEDLTSRSPSRPVPAKSLYKAWVRSGRKGPRTQRKKHQRKKAPRSWRKVRSSRLRARRRRGQ